MRFRSFSEIVFPFRRGWSRLYSACISPACVLKNYVNEEKKFSFSVVSFSHFYYLRVSCFARSFFIYELPPVVLHFPRRCPFSCLPLSTTFSPSLSPLSPSRSLCSKERSSTYLDSTSRPLLSSQRNEVLPLLQVLLS